jgi:hypothetical protein
MTIGKRTGIILGIIILLGALAFAATQIISPSADELAITGTDATVTGFIKTARTTQRSQQLYKYSLQAIGTTYYLTASTAEINTFLQNNVNKPQAVVVKGKQRTIGLPSYDALIVTDIAKQPLGQSFTGTGTITTLEGDQDFPFRFTSDGKEYFANAIGSASFDPEALAASGDSVRVSGYVYDFEFIKDTRHELIMNDATVVAAATNSTAPTPTATPATLDNSLNEVKVTLSSVTPSSGKASGEVTLKGAGFDEYYNTIKFNDAIIAIVAPIDATTIKFTIPSKTCAKTSASRRCQDASLKAGDYKVTVTDSADQTSNELTYTVK